jgi:hypothetical protein
MQDFLKPIFENPFKGLPIYLVDKNGNIEEGNDEAGAHIKSVEIESEFPHIRIYVCKGNHSTFYFNQPFIPEGEGEGDLDFFSNNYFSLFFDKREAELRSLYIKAYMIDKEWTEVDNKIAELEKEKEILKEKEELVSKKINEMEAEKLN